MRVFICEFVTGGGMGAEALPASLAREAALIRDAMLRDVSALPGVREVSLACDARLPLDRAVIIPPGADPWPVWRELAAGADVVWPVAPETGGILARLVEDMAASGAHVLASTPAAIRVATSKRETAHRLAAAGLPHIPTFALGEALLDEGVPRVTKPDDGAGCEDTRLWPAHVPARPDRSAGMVIQPFVAGEAASLTVLAQAGATQLLAANRQHIRVDEGRIHLAGLAVGAVEDADGRLAALAAAVVRTIPGLEGIFGIDLVLTESGPVVVEVNPRLTTAYAGLRDALGCNPAGLLSAFSVNAGSAPAARAVELAFA